MVENYLKLFSCNKLFLTSLKTCLKDNLCCQENETVALDIDYKT